MNKMTTQTRSGSSAITAKCYFVEEKQHKKDGHADHEKNADEAHQSIVGQQQVMQKFHGSFQSSKPNDGVN